MPEKTTTHFAFPYPTSAGEVKNGAVDIEELAKKLDEFLFERLLTLSEKAVSGAATSGQMVKCTAAITVTAPAVAASALFGVVANGHAVTVKAAGAAKIFGDFLAEAGVTECKLVGMQHLILFSDGTNWFIIAGEPKREQAYGAETSRANNTEFEPSATRETWVTVNGASSIAGAWLKMNVFVGGQEIAELTTGPPSPAKPQVAYGFLVLPGVKWKAQVEAGVGAKEEESTLTSRYLPR